MKSIRIALIALICFVFSCSKDDPEPTSAVTINIDSTTDADGCDSSNGNIVVSATGGDGNFTYSIDNNNFQSSNTFNNLAPGDYEITAKDGEGKTATAEAKILSGVSLSNAIIPIINANCAVSNCHDGSQSIPNFTVKSNIISRAGNIRSLTGSKTMPPPSSGRSLTDSEIALIDCWVNDGAADN